MTDAARAVQKLGEWTTPRGAASLRAIGPDVVIIEMSGYVDDAVGAGIATALRAWLANATSVHTFWDLEGLTAYHSAVRTLNVQVLLDHKRQVASTHAFSKSKLVRLGILAAKIALGGRLRMYEDRASFDAARDDVLNAEAS